MVAFIELFVVHFTKYCVLDGVQHFDEFGSGAKKFRSWDFARKQDCLL